MYQAQAIIERVRRISQTVQRLDVAVDKPHANIGAGQIYLARTIESSDPYLREPWTPVHKEGATVTVERPATQNFGPGDLVNLLGPVGKPIPLRDNMRTLLLLAYDSAPSSLLMLAETALGKGAAVAIALLGAAVHYPLEALPQEIEVIRGDAEGNWSEQSTTLRWADQIVAVAPPPYDMPYYTRLLESIRGVRVEVPEHYVYALVQPPMPCGVGACQACLVRCGKEEPAACIEGPAFDLVTLTTVSVENR
jgi:hypothetical protein